MKQVTLKIEQLIEENLKWIKENPGKALGLGAAGLGALAGGVYALNNTDGMQEEPMVGVQQSNDGQFPIASVNKLILGGAAGLGAAGLAGKAQHNKIKNRNDKK
jgi:hypothetical protein